jgi:hypothetical protein
MSAPRPTPPLIGGYTGGIFCYDVHSLNLLQWGKAAKQNQPDSVDDVKAILSRNLNKQTSGQRLLGGGGRPIYRVMNTANFITPHDEEFDEIKLTADSVMEVLRNLGDSRRLFGGKNSTLPLHFLS